MGRNPLPTAEYVARGRDRKDGKAKAKLHADKPTRRIVESSPLGAPEQSLTHQEQVFWERFKHEAKWLQEADRPLIVELCRIRARSANLGADEYLPPQVMSYYLKMLGDVGMTPVGRARIVVNADEAEYQRARAVLNGETPEKVKEKKSEEKRQSYFS